MAGRSDDHMGVAREGLGDGLQSPRCASHDGEVHFVVAKLLQHDFAVVRRKLHRDPGVQFQETRQQWRHHVFRRAHHGDYEPSLRQAFARRERLVGIAQLLRDDAAVLVQFGSGFGQVDLLAQALEQRQPRLLLQQLHLHRYRRLGEVHFGRRARKRQVARNRLEHLQLAQRRVPERHDLQSGIYINESLSYR